MSSSIRNNFYQHVESLVNIFNNRYIRQAITTLGKGGQRLQKVIRNPGDQIFSFSSQMLVNKYLSVQH